MGRPIIWFLFYVLSMYAIPSKSVAAQSFSFSNNNSSTLFCKNIEKAVPAVVFIATQTNPFETSYFHEFFRPIYEWYWPSSLAHGSGFIISPDGYVVTNSHVIDDVTDMVVILPYTDRKIWKATLIGSDPRTDIAVLKIENDNGFTFPYLKFGNSNNAKVGEQIIVIGNPIDSRLESTITMGIISGKDRNNFGFEIEGFIQTDAPINSGNSGGPLINSDGEVIGVTKFIYSHFFGFEGLGFAIPSSTANIIVNQIITKGKVSQGFLGVEVEDLGESAFDAYFFENLEGVRVKSIFQDSPAEESGLEMGDLILAINDYPIRSAQSLKNQIWVLEPKAKIILKVDRHGKIYEIPIELGSDLLSRMVSAFSPFFM